MLDAAERDKHLKIDKPAAYITLMFSSPHLCLSFFLGRDRWWTDFQIGGTMTLIFNIFNSLEIFFLDLMLGIHSPKVYFII